MKPSRSLLAIGLVLGFAPGARAEVTVDRVTGDGAFAEFHYSDGDTVTFVSVTTSAQQTLRPPQPGGPKDSPLTTVAILRFNATTGENLILASGSTTTQTFTIERDMSSARLVAVVNVKDSVLGTRYDVPIDLTWTATGELVRDQSQSHFNEQGLVVNAHFVGSHRSAAVAGTVIARGANVTPGGAQMAEIQSNNSGSVMVQVP